MQVSDLFDRLATGQLSNLNLADEETGLIEKPYWKKLINYSNSGLLKLYSRFILKEREVLIECRAHITKYELNSKYSLVSNKVSDPYIIDFPHDPFNDDAIKILGVYDNSGNKYILNDTNNGCSLFTPKPLTLQVPAPVQGSSLSVTYQARHDPLCFTDMSETNLFAQCINIPFFLEDPLTNFIASEYYSHLNGQENTLKGQEFFAKFDAACIEIEDNDLANETFSTTNEKFYKRGFR